MYNLYIGETEWKDPPNISLADVFSSTIGDFFVVFMHFLLKIKLFELVNTLNIPIYIVAYSKEHVFFFS